MQCFVECPGGRSFQGGTDVYHSLMMQYWFWFIRLVQKYLRFLLLFSMQKLQLLLHQSNTIFVSGGVGWGSFPSFTFGTHPPHFDSSCLIKPWGFCQLPSMFISVVYRGLRKDYWVSPWTWLWPGLGPGLHLLPGLHTNHSNKGQNNILDLRISTQTLYPQSSTFLAMNRKKLGDTLAWLWGVFLPGGLVFSSVSGFHVWK